MSAPLAESVALCPLQIGAGVLVVTFKLFPTLTVTEFDPLHPLPLSVATTVYVVVVVGDTLVF